MQDSIPDKRKTRIIYLVIILAFLLLAWFVWWFFEARIKEVGSKKKDQVTSAETMMKNKFHSPMNTDNKFNF